MTIDEYLEHSGLTAESLADASGISAVSLSRIRRGEQNTSRNVMRRIIAASGNLITAAGLIHNPVNTSEMDGPSSGNDGDFSTQIQEVTA